MLAREDGKEIEDVEKQVLVRARHRGDQTLVRRDHLVLIIRFFRCDRLHQVSDDKSIGV